MHGAYNNCTGYSFSSVYCCQRQNTVLNEMHNHVCMLLHILKCQTLLQREELSDYCDCDRYCLETNNDISCKVCLLEGTSSGHGSVNWHWLNAQTFRSLDCTSTHTPAAESRIKSYLKNVLLKMFNFRNEWLSYTLIILFYAVFQHWTPTE